MDVARHEQALNDVAYHALHQWRGSIAAVGLRADMSWDRESNSEGLRALEVSIFFLDAQDEVVDVIEGEVMRNGAFIGTPDQLAAWLREEIENVVTTARRLADRPRR